MTLNRSPFTMNKVPPTVAIIGGGALGAALAGILVSRLTSSSLAKTRPRIVLFEKAERIGRGLAYAKDGSPHLLNTSADAMSLVPGKRAHFFEWLKKRGLAPRDPEEYFCARERFGDYVEDFFVGVCEHAKSRGTAVTVVQDEVIALSSRPIGGYRVHGRAHCAVDADVAVLALGHLPSNVYAALRGPQFFGSPYPSAAFIRRIAADAKVAVLGSGLSAIDAALALSGAGHRGTVTMISRGGMLPRVRGPLPEHTLTHVTRAAIAQATDHGKRALRWSTVLRWLEHELEDHGQRVLWDRDFPAWVDATEHLTSEVLAAERGARLWQSVGEALNPMMDILWHHLADEDRHLFLTSFRSRFMAHWVPIPLVTAHRLLLLIKDGRLRVERGLGEVTREAEGFRVTLASGNLHFDAIIDATGSPRDPHESDSSLLGALLRQGTVSAHPSGGLRVDFESLQVLRGDGRPDPSLYALGNLTSGTHLFTSALDVNVERANRMARYVIDELRRLTDRDHGVDATSHTS